MSAMHGCKSKRRERRLRRGRRTSVMRGYKNAMRGYKNKQRARLLRLRRRRNGRRGCKSERRARPPRLSSPNCAPS